MADYLKIPELARRLDVSEKTARRYVKAGTLPSTFIGGAYRVTEEDLEEFLRRAEVRPEEASPKAQASSQPSLNGLLEDERRAVWEAAVDDARRLREGGRARLEELLAAWQASTERGELDSARRGYVNEIEELFNEAYGATHSLADILLAADGIPAPNDWEEVTVADRFYRTLAEVMREAGFRIRERKGGPLKFEEPNAA